MKIKIRTKLIISFYLGLLLMMALALYSMGVSQKTLQESVARSSMFLAQEMLTRIDAVIFFKTEEFQAHSGHFYLRKDLLASNQAFAKLVNVQTYITQRDREWVSAPKKEITPFMKELLTNNLSNTLREELVEFYEKKYGYKVFPEVCVTNKYGAIVASTKKTSDYLQTDEEWYQKAIAEKDYWVGPIEYDESSEVFANDIVISLYDEGGNFSGIFKAVLNTGRIIRDAELFGREYETTRISLITKDGRLIYRTIPFKFLEDVSEKTFFKRIKDERGSFTAKVGGRDKLYSFARSTGIRGFKGLGWILLLEHDVDEILKHAISLRNRMMIVSSVLIIIGMVIAFFISFFITKPLAKLTKGAKIIGKGDLDHRVEIKAQDEIGELALAFNEMAEKRKRAQEEIKIYLSKLEATNRELDAFTYSVSHDLRAPLRAITGFSEMIVEDYGDKLDQDGQRQLGVIQNSAQDMGKLIDDLLAFSRLGRKSLTKSKIDMHTLADEVTETLQLIEKKQKIRLNVKDLPSALGDRAMIREVFVNLLSNAIKYTGPVKEPVIEIDSRTEGDENIYYVTDNGVGFDMKYVDKLFQVFQRLHSAEEFEGTGIGLALVQRIIHRHGGRVWGEGKVNEGATFYFSLPRI